MGLVHLLKLNLKYIYTVVFEIKGNFLKSSSIRKCFSVVMFCLDASENKTVSKLPVLPHTYRKYLEGNG